MANIKSQKKRAITNLKRNAENTIEKSTLKTALKNVDKAILAKDKNLAIENFNKASSLLDKAITSKIKHRNYVSRKKAKLQLQINSL